MDQVFKQEAGDMVEYTGDTRILILEMITLVWS